MITQRGGTRQPARARRRLAKREQAGHIVVMIEPRSMAERAGAPQRLTAPQAAFASLRAAMAGPVAECRVPVEQAIGLVLAAPLVAAEPLPDHPAAARDGWAVPAMETLGAGPYAPAPLSCAPCRVAPGDPMPPGTDAVLPPFDLDAEGPLPQALATLAPGEGVRRPGEEIAAGCVLRGAGERLLARDLPALAALGITSIMVRAPRLAWITAGPGLDTLRPFISALAGEAGASLHPAAPTAPDAASVAAALRAVAPGHDLVLLVGGTGEGPEDHAAAGLSEAGQPLFHGIGANPGMAAGAGIVEGRPVLLLPGRAEDAVAAWILLVRPALDAMTGAAPSPPLRLRLTRKVASTVGLAELVPLRLDGNGGAEPLAVGALPLAALSAAAAILLVPPGAEGYEAGTDIAAQAL